MITTEMEVIAHAFPRHKRDDDLVNPFMSGYTLANEISKLLRKRNYSEVSVDHEDHGWHVYGYPKGSTVLFDTIFSSLADPHGLSSDPVELVVSVTPIEKTIGFLFWKKDVGDEVMRHANLVFGFLKDHKGIEIIREETAVW